MTKQTGRTGLPGILIVTFLASLGTGVVWHGLPFIAKHTYEFSQVRNLTMFAVMGAVYTAGAFGAGRVVRALARWLSPRAILGWSLMIQAGACALPVMTRGEWALWVTGGAVSILSSFIWPIMESYLTSGRHGPAMRSAIGWFNVTWMPAVIAPMFIMAPLLEHHGAWSIGGLAIANVLAIAALPAFRPRPVGHDLDAAIAHVPDRYMDLLRSARVLLPLSYVIIAGLHPVLPYRFEQIGIEQTELETPSTATWMVARVFALIVMWRIPFWHGRWGTLLFGAMSMAGGFAVIMLAPTLPIMIGGFAAMGVGAGVLYYAALYYAMAVGQAEVDAGGTHEGLIGAGYAIGPLAGLAGVALGGVGAIIGVMLTVLAVGGVGAVRPYRAWSKRRAG